MLDIRLIREQPNQVKAGLASLGADPALVDQVLSLDEDRRRIEGEVSTMRARRNSGSKEIGKAKDNDQREAMKAEMRALGDEVSAGEARLKQAEADQQTLLLNIPNLPLPSVPVGADDRENIVARTVGEPRVFDFQPKPHWELGAALGILDIERGTKISGSRFYVL